MEATSALNRRQLWAKPTPTSKIPIGCRAISLPSGGFLDLGDATLITLTQDAVYEPACTDYPNLNVSSSGSNVSIIDDKDPFYASTLPQVYAIATATIISYMLLIILFITPRTFFVGGAGGGNGFLGRRGMISGASGSTSVIGIGSRPWLQKVAALTVAVSLSLATADTLRVAEQQYDAGFQDVMALTDEIADDLQFRVVRVISDTCLWLAQAQTLIRLFPRHREKVIIKWTAFALILLDFIFSILNSFVYGNARVRPRTFVDTVPALNYLFAIALSILYMAWVLYYSISKRRFAFYHPKMRNICLMALLSLAAILVPVVFFVIDIASPRLSVWGNYVRWVGAAAASVVVWEWVERIEALERDENKDGILGREIFDGDEMLRDTPSSETNRRARSRGGGGGSTSSHEDPTSGDENRNGGGIAGLPRGVISVWEGIVTITNRFGKTRLQGQNRLQGQRPRNFRLRARGVDTSRTAIGFNGQGVTPPPATGFLVSRADTTSVASTIYPAHHRPQIMKASEGVKRHDVDSVHATSANYLSNEERTVSTEERTETETCPKSFQASQSRSQGATYSWLRLSNPFKRQRASPPPEVSLAMATNGQNPPVTGHNGPLSRDTAPTSHLGALWGKRNTKCKEIPLPVTIIPWQPRGRAYLDSIVDDAPTSSEPNQSGTSTEPVRHLTNLPTSESTQSTRRSVTPLRDASGFLPRLESPASTLAAPQHASNSDIMSAQQAPYLEQQHSNPPGAGGSGRGSGPML